MPLSIGARLGPYEILSAIGAGGMGEVYRARDTRLGRTVAIKVLPAGASTDPARRLRFEQEARAVSTLNHPHICVLHDIGREGDTGFLVMEYLDGQTLAQRLRKGPLPLAQVFELGPQVADALATAHRHGIVHRDLKPANIMLTKAGAKLLDFGLAKLKEPPSAPEGGASALSADAPATMPGAVMGTVPYMAPEQLEGKETDARTDLFAFGCVLYEMLTARRAFGGTTEASVISAIMSGEPAPPSTVQPLTPPALDRLVRRCLAKDPDDRWQHAADVAEDLRGISQDAVTPASGRAPGRVRRAWMAGAAALFIVILVGTAAWVAREAWSPTTAAPVRTDVAMPAGTSFQLLANSTLAIAPDGRGLVYGARDEAGTSRLYWQRLDGSTPRAIPGTDGAYEPFFSPDGTHLGFGLRSKLVTLALQSGQPGDGGPLEPRADVAEMRGASWGEGGTILYSPGPFAGLWRVSANGGGASELTRPDPAKGEISHRWPCFLPGGRAALFTVDHASGRMDRGATAVLSLDSGRWKRIIEGGAYARYLPTGYIIYARNGALLAVRFDITTLTPVGPPVPVANGVKMHWEAGNAEFDVSPSGSLVFVPAPGVLAKYSLVWLDQNGQVEVVTSDQRGPLGRLELSRDGQKLAVEISDANRETLAVYRLASRSWQSLTSEADEECPVWSPTGDRLAFASNRDGAFNLYITRPDESGQAERVTHSLHSQYPYSWSTDGRYLAYIEQTDPGFTTWILPLDTRQPWRWVPEGENVSGPAFSPDGRWLAYHSQETGEWEVHVRPFPGPGPRYTVSGAEGGLGPVWTRDGRQILYLARPGGDNRILAKDVFVDPSLRFAHQHVAFAFPFTAHWYRGYNTRVGALAPDGRLLLVRPDPVGASEIHSLTLIRHWVEEVKAKVAAEAR